MKGTQKIKNPHFGSKFDDFLAEEGILADVESVAIKRVIAHQIAQMAGLLVYWFLREIKLFFAMWHILDDR